MILVEGSHNVAKVFSDVAEEKSIEQIRELMNQEYVKNSWVRVMPDYHYGKGCTVGLTMTLHNKVDPHLVGVDIGCLDKDTEFLTQYGWKKISEYSNGDMVLQYNKENDLAEFVIPQNYIKKSCDAFYYFKNEKGLDQMLSEEHKMLIWKGYKSKGYSLEDYHPNDFIDKNLSSGYYGIKTSFDLVQKQIDFLDDEIRLLIMVSADGIIRSEHNMNNKIELHFKKQRKIDRAFEILNNLNVDYEAYYAKDGTVYIDFYYGKKINKSLSVLWGADKRQLEIVTKECLLWDGHSGYRSYYSSIDKENADVIQFAFASNNIRAGISISKSKNKNHNDVYVVTPTKNNIIGVSENPKIIVVKNEFKYCFTVPSGYFIARRNGKIFITGNCGVKVVEFTGELDFGLLDYLIRYSIPSGKKVREYPHKNANLDMLELINAKFDMKRAMLSVGTLGGGNHFIEVNQDDNGKTYLVIHSGSRKLGVEVCDFYKNIAIERMKDNQFDIQGFIQEMKDAGREQEIESALNLFYKNRGKLDTRFAYVSGLDFEAYIRDMIVAQEFAQLNRDTMASIIIELMNWKVVDEFTSVHNYIDTNSMILRKGAISARSGEKVIIPMNMRDGSIIGVGKGNEDWNFSAPHGSGRILGRNQAKKLLTMEEYKKEMDGIYSTSISKETLDESPMAYKGMDYIIRNISETVDITNIIRPLYNFKARE